MEGKCIIISAPSGAGKTTLVHHLLELGLGLEFSISACSRPRRENEVDGKDYYFLSVEEFMQKIKNDELLEWEEVYPGQFYGTLRSEIDRIWKNGKHVIFDVDVVGGLKLKKVFGENALAIFVMPPSVDTLKIRLEERNSDPPEKIALRVQKAREEVKSASLFDKVVVNDQLSHALGDAEHMVKNFLMENGS